LKQTDPLAAIAKLPDSAEKAEVLRQLSKLDITAFKTQEVQLSGGKVLRIATSQTERLVVWLAIAVIGA
jgi:ABC-type phosphate/phosphonate transport system ATPase subunit